MSGIKIIQPSWSTAKNVHALVTTRVGGISQAPFDSLNLAMHVGDKQQDVLANRVKLNQSLNLPHDPVWLNQIHSTVITELTSTKLLAIPTSDGAMTRSSNVVCAVMTADCLPLFLSNQAGDKVAVLHVGWRGLADGIIENGIALFSEAAQNVIAWAGPCISVDYFEIGAEVRDRLGGSVTAYRRSNNEGKFYADMYQLTGERLAQLGVTNYSHSEYCSFQDDELFFSHRRDQGTGRMASIIWFE